MERMTKVDKNIQTAQNMLSGIIERCYVLEQENKSLREQLIQRNIQNDNLGRKNKELREENAELKSELSKFRDSFKKYRDYEKEELAESCYDLARENEKLKEEIGKLVMNK